MGRHQTEGLPSRGDCSRSFSVLQSNLDVRLMGCHLTRQGITSILRKAMVSRFKPPLSVSPTHPLELGSLCILEYPSLEVVVPSLPAHTSNCICVGFDPTGRYVPLAMLHVLCYMCYVTCALVLHVPSRRFATGSADASVCIFDAYEQICTSTLPHWEYAIRAVAFSHDGELLAASSSDRQIDIVSGAHYGPACILALLPLRC
jgi:hypothetical protein